MLCLERKRTERSRRSFVLMLLESATLLKPGQKEDVFEKVVIALSHSTRDTDIKGWYTDGFILGIIFTEIGAEAEKTSVAKALLTKVTDALSSTLSIKQINELRLSFHVFPEDWDESGPGGSADSTLYPDLTCEDSRKAERVIKRMMDIGGSLLALILLAPAFLIISVAIKLTSRGPVLFRQQRLGLHGGKFTFLKFKSMQCKTGAAIHQEYMKEFISGKSPDGHGEAGCTTVYKITADPRVTPVGRFLRKTSLDELPQFLNVLRGDMSLVGPRPPIPYEFECYDIWHRDRLLAVTPGITGLWQVEGRSKVKFDDMVRMDLKYARSWSLWLDIKILCQTPRAVLTANGAY